MSLDELQLFNDELHYHPEAVIFKGDHSLSLPNEREIASLREIAHAALVGKLFAIRSIRDNVPELNQVLKKYHTNFASIMSQLEMKHEMNETMRWRQAAELALKTVLASNQSYKVMAHDAGIITRFIDELTSSVIIRKSSRIKLFDEARPLMVTERNCRDGELSAAMKP